MLTFYKALNFKANQETSEKQGLLENSIFQENANNFITQR